MNTETIKRDEQGTAYITEQDGQTRIYAIELDNNEGWALERQAIGGDENPERLSDHETEDEAMEALEACIAAESAEEITISPGNHIPSQTAEGLCGEAICGVTAKYNTGDHGMIYRSVRGYGKDGCDHYCQECVALFFADEE